MKKINTILIANRGEIASRVIRTCKKMGIRSVAVFSDADSKAPFVAEANVSVYIGESTPSASYLDQDKIIHTAKRVGADAIHPGYGFLSENTSFAKRCEEENIIFIGPNPEAIAAMGSKSEAKALMQKHQVPTVPGYQGKDQSVETLSKAAKEMGFPVLLKATAGGGGKGMRIVREEGEIKKAIDAAKRESKNAFGDDELIVEKYISSGRHIEFQIFGDKHGNAIHVLERECSIQRRYQKVIEESPSPIMNEALRAKMGKAAVHAAKALKYDNAGTVEFIYDDQSGDFYFLEVNTRLQVEHPVTEEVTGLDLVQMQIESAQGMPLSLKQEDIIGKGYAIECRLYAEDASNDFLPVTGKIESFVVPKVDGLRVESAVQSGSEISIYYDPMIAKLIVWDQNRQAAHRKMSYVLRNMICLGTTTNQGFLSKILEHADFQVGKYDTHFIQNSLSLGEEDLGKEHVLTACAVACLWDWYERDRSRGLLKSLPSGWRNNYDTHQEESYVIEGGAHQITYRSFGNDSFEFYFEGETYLAKLLSKNLDSIQVEIDGLRSEIFLVKRGQTFFLQNEYMGSVELVQKERFPEKKSGGIKGGYEAPMPSQVVKVLVEQGQKVQAGEGLVILSSMKMENMIEATEDGTVEEVFVQAGENIEAGLLLLKLATEPED